LFKIIRRSYIGNGDYIFGDQEGKFNHAVKNDE